MSLVLVVLVICTGIGLACYGSVQFVWIGFVLVLVASILGTLRWVLTQYVMSLLEPTQNKYAHIYLFPLICLQEFGGGLPHLARQRHRSLSRCARRGICGRPRVRLCPRFLALGRIYSISFCCIYIILECKII